jgi:hypothetical protein
MSLKNLVKKETKNWLPYDQKNNVYFNVSFLHKSELRKINAMNTKKVLNPKTRQMEEELDVESFKEDMFAKTVNDWKGITYRWLASQVPLKTDEIEDMDAEITFSQENLNEIVDMISGLDMWLLDSVQEGANFQKIREEEDLKN